MARKPQPSPLPPAETITVNGVTFTRMLEREVVLPANDNRGTGPVKSYRYLCPKCKMALTGEPWGSGECVACCRMCGVYYGSLPDYLGD